MLLQYRINYWGEIENKIKFLVSPFQIRTELFQRNTHHLSNETILAILVDMQHILDEASTWDGTELYSIITQYAEIKNLKVRDVLQTIRIAVTMQDITPGGATDVLEVLGKAESINRIGLIINQLLNE